MSGRVHRLAASPPQVCKGGLGRALPQGTAGGAPATAAASSSQSRPGSFISAGWHGRQCGRPSLPLPARRHRRRPPHATTQPEAQAKQRAGNRGGRRRGRGASAEHVAKGSAPAHSRGRGGRRPRRVPAAQLRAAAAEGAVHSPQRIGGAQHCAGGILCVALQHVPPPTQVRELQHGGGAVAVAAAAPGSGRSSKGALLRVGRGGQAHHRIVNEAQRLIHGRLWRVSTAAARVRGSRAPCGAHRGRHHVQRSQGAVVIIGRQIVLPCAAAPAAVQAAATVGEERGRGRGVVVVGGLRRGHAKRGAGRASGGEDRGQRVFRQLPLHRVAEGWLGSLPARKPASQDRNLVAFNVQRTNASNDPICGCCRFGLLSSMTSALGPVDMAIIDAQQCLSPGCCSRHTVARQSTLGQW